MHCTAVSLLLDSTRFIARQLISQSVHTAVHKLHTMLNASSAIFNALAIYLLYNKRSIPFAVLHVSATAAHNHCILDNTFSISSYRLHEV
jgi:hypothetical protein